jgi:hypothetical protein
MASNFDPTGVLTIAAAFMHPSCDVPRKRPETRALPSEVYGS